MKTLITALLFLAASVLSAESDETPGFLREITAWPNEKQNIEDFWLDEDQQRLFLLNRPMLQILDVGNPLQPKLLGELTLQGYVKSFFWADRMDRLSVVGSTAYINTKLDFISPQPQLMVDVSDPTKPTSLGNTDFPAMWFSGNDRYAAGSNPRSQDPLSGETFLFEVTKSGDLVKKAQFFGSFSGGITTFSEDRLYFLNETAILVVDLSGDISAARPIQATSVPPYSSHFGAMGIWEHYLFTGNPVEPKGERELIVWDFSEPTAVRKLSTVPILAGDLADFSVDFPYLYFTCRSHGQEGTPVFAVDISDINSPKIVGKSQLDGQVHDVRVHNSIVFVTSDGQLRLFESLAANPIETSASERAYETWRKKQFAADAFEDSSPMADPDHDGNSNLIEFATGSNPLRPADSKVTISADAENVRFLFWKARGMSLLFDYIVEASSNLAPDSWSPVKSTKVNDLFGSEQHEVVLPTGDAFARLRIVGK